MFPEAPQGFEHHGAGDRQEWEGEHEALDLPPYCFCFRPGLELSQSTPRLRPISRKEPEQLRDGNRGSGAPGGCPHQTDRAIFSRVLRAVLQTEAGRRLGQLRDGPRGHVVRVSSSSVRRRVGWAASTLCLGAAQALVYLHPTRFAYACLVACGSCDPSGPFVAGTLPCLEPLARV